MYCESLERREIYKAQVSKELEDGEAEKAHRNARKGELQKHVRWSKEHEQPDPNQKKKVAPPAYNIHSSITEAETQAKIDLATSASHSYNAPMLVSWLLRHCQEEETVIQGLNQAYKHLQTTEGCNLLARHDLHNTLYRIAAHFMSFQPDIVHLCLQCLRQLVDCNETRDMVFNPSNPDADGPGSGGQPADGGSVSNQSILSHLTPPNPNVSSMKVRCTMVVCEILMRFGRLSAEQVVFNYAKSFVLTCYKECGAEMIHAFLRLMHWSATTVPRITFFFNELKLLKIILKLFKVYGAVSRVLVPAITLLHWLVSQLPPAFQAALDANVIALTVASLKYVHDDEVTQLTALKLIQLLAKTSQGFKQLDSIRGAWQELTQGTIIGEELVHHFPGPLQNKGWAIGEAPFRPLREIQGEQSRLLAQTALQQAPKSSWTPHSLRQYMGLSLAGQKLAINTEESQVFFELLTTLDMLPNTGEIKEDWFKRLRRYEQESELSIQEMVETIQEMRRREKIRLQMQKQGLIVGLEGLQMSSLGNFTAKQLKAAEAAGAATSSTTSASCSPPTVSRNRYKCTDLCSTRPPPPSLSPPPPAPTPTALGAGPGGRRAATINAANFAALHCNPCVSALNIARLIVVDKPAPSFSADGRAVVTSCAGVTTTPASMALLWRVYDEDSAAVVYRANGTRLRLPPFTLPAGRTFVVELTAQTFSGAGQFLSSAAATRTLQVQRGQLVALVSGGSRRLLPRDRNTTLSAEASYDEDAAAATLFFDWRCSVVSVAAYGDDCGGILDAPANRTRPTVVVLGERLDDAATYAVTLSVSAADGRFAQATAEEEAARRQQTWPPVVEHGDVAKEVAALLLVVPALLRGDWSATASAAAVADAAPATPPAEAAEAKAAGGSSSTAAPPPPPPPPPQQQHTLGGKLMTGLTGLAAQLAEHAASPAPKTTSKAFAATKKALDSIVPAVFATQQSLRGFVETVLHNHSYL
eukprot:gene6429-4627_t